MAVGQLSAEDYAIASRVRGTVSLLQRRGYALSPARLGEVCLGGQVGEQEIRWTVAADPELEVAEGLVVERRIGGAAPAIRERADGHAAASAEYLAMTVDFVRRLVATAPFITSVSIAGSLASGGFRSSDDVDLNLVVEDGYRHLAYVVVNLLGVMHAMRHRSKPVDDLTRRPLAPRLMTVNLVLERSQCRPLARQDEDMAFELLMAEPVFGLEALDEIVRGNPGLLEHFPQLAERASTHTVVTPRRLSGKLFPTILDHPSRWLGRSAWRYMQWTRRHRPDALARVAFVRSTMRPYTLFDDA